MQGIAQARVIKSFRCVPVPFIPTEQHLGCIDGAQAGVLGRV